MGLTYIGFGAFVPPYPARDLTDEEVKQFGKEALLATNLYKEDKGLALPKAKQFNNKEEEKES